MKIVLPTNDESSQGSKKPNNPLNGSGQSFKKRALLYFGVHLPHEAINTLSNYNLNNVIILQQDDHTSTLLLEKVYYQHKDLNTRPSNWRLLA